MQKDTNVLSELLENVLLEQKKKLFGTISDIACLELQFFAELVIHFLYFLQTWMSLKRHLFRFMKINACSK